MTGISKAKIAHMWETLIGPGDRFSKESRSANAVLLISLILMMINLPMNMVMGLMGSSVIAIALGTMLCILYTLSRLYKQTRLAVTLYSIFSYIGLAMNFRYNDGIDGSSIFLFFLSFQLIIAITPKKQHLIWIALHVLTVAGLIGAEYFYPSIRLNIYTDRANRFSDIAVTYVFSIIFIYVITAYLINSYIKEKKLAKERADAIEAQNNVLKDIAWVQSHKVRSHVATILGLTDILQQDPDDPDNKLIIRNLKNVAHELDNVIRDINHLTTEKKNVKAEKISPILQEK